MKKKKINLSIVSIPIENTKPITIEFRKAINSIIKKWNKYKKLPNKCIKLTEKTQNEIIELSKIFKIFRSLRWRWSIETEQELLAFHGLSAEDFNCVEKEIKKEVEYERRKSKK